MRKVPHIQARQPSLQPTARCRWPAWKPSERHIQAHPGTSPPPPTSTTHSSPPLTHPKDLIDPALLRPGRLEVHVEINAPDEDGRVEILYLLFRPLVKGGFVGAADAEAWSREVAVATDGWTGADLAGLMRGAASFAIDRSLSIAKGAPLDPVPVPVPVPDTVSVPTGATLQIHIAWEDIRQAMGESSKGVSTGKRARVRRFLARAMQRLTGRGGRGGGGGAKRKRTFEEILLATYDDEDEDDDDDDDDEGTEAVTAGGSRYQQPLQPPSPPPPSPPAFTDIGGTLMF